MTEHPVLKKYYGSGMDKEYEVLKQLKNGSLSLNDLDTNIRTEYSILLSTMNNLNYYNILTNKYGNLGFMVKHKEAFDSILANPMSLENVNYDLRSYELCKFAVKNNPKSIVHVPVYFVLETNGWKTLWNHYIKIV